MLPYSKIKSYKIQYNISKLLHRNCSAFDEPPWTTDGRIPCDRERLRQIFSNVCVCSAYIRKRIISTKLLALHIFGIFFLFDEFSARKATNQWTEKLKIVANYHYKLISEASNCIALFLLSPTYINIYSTVKL